MRIGILTFHEADSYGAVLQAYALQTVLERLGAESEFITFRKDPAGEEKNSSNPMIRRLLEEGKKRAKIFSLFRDEYFRISRPFSKGEYAQIDAEYDRFLAGSDQIWNFSISEADERYFLPFASANKRYSYAASFGEQQIPEKMKAWCAKQLAGFEGLSVREESGRRMIKELTGRDALVCPDPTVLLTQEDWKQIATHVQNQPYALLFLLQYSKELSDAAEKWARERNMALQVVTAAFMPRFGFSPWSSIGPTGWLGLIAGASAVFTNSFHGVEFSLLFQKPVYVGLLEGELQGRNGRIVELMEAVGLGGVSEFVPQIVPQDRLETYLSEKRTVAMQYLKRIIIQDRG